MYFHREQLRALDIYDDSSSLSNNSLRLHSPPSCDPYQTMSSPDEFADNAIPLISSPDASPTTHNEPSPSPPSSSSSPLILYSPPTIWGLLRGAAINLFLPFLNGLMLGFGELLAHETAFRLGWAQTRVSSIEKVLMACQR